MKFLKESYLPYFKNAFERMPSPRKVIPLLGMEDFSIDDYDPFSGARVINNLIKEYWYVNLYNKEIKNDITSLKWLNVPNCSHYRSACKFLLRNAADRKVLPLGMLCGLDEAKTVFLPEDLCNDTKIVIKHYRDLKAKEDFDLTLKSNSLVDTPCNSLVFKWLRTPQPVDERLVTLTQLLMDLNITRVDPNEAMMQERSTIIEEAIKKVRKVVKEREDIEEIHTLGSDTSSFITKQAFIYNNTNCIPILRLDLNVPHDEAGPNAENIRANVIRSIRIRDCYGLDMLRDCSGREETNQEKIYVLLRYSTNPLTYPSDQPYEEDE